MLTQERLKELLDYDPESGVFVWRVRLGKSMRAGDIAGWDDGYGYRRITITGIKHRAHRLAWLYIHGSWPNSEIDHINGNRSDNRMSNLRLATRSENMQNTQKARSDSRSGLKGAIWHTASGKWRAVVKLQGKDHHLGYFKSPEEAHIAYMAAKSSIHVW